MLRQKSHWELGGIQIITIDQTETNVLNISIPQPSMSIMNGIMMLKKSKAAGANGVTEEK